MPEVDYWYLCFNCGFITPYEKWQMLKWDDEGENLIASLPGESDPICQCPVCHWNHTDDDGNPGILDGPLSSLTVERIRAEIDWAEHWQDTVEEVFGL